LQYVPNALKTGAVCAAAVQKGVNLQNTQIPLKIDAIYLAAMQHDGSLLQFVPDSFKTKAICLAAVQQNSSALQYVPEALKTEDFEAMIRSAISSGSGGSGYGVGLTKPISK